MEKIRLDAIEEAIADFREGKFVIVVDDEDRENEGDLIVAAEKITPEQVNFMLKHARGVLCAPITLSRCKELDLNYQVTNNTSVLGTPFTVTVDKLEGCTELLRFGRWPILLLLRRHLVGRDILIRCMHRTRGCFVVPDILRRLSIWLVWRDFIRQVR